jgi:hypothetical protein
MKKRLDAVNLPLRYGIVFDRFIHSIANQNQDGATLVIAWEQACEDESLGVSANPPPMEQLPTLIDQLMLACVTLLLAMEKFSGTAFGSLVSRQSPS